MQTPTERLRLRRTGHPPLVFDGWPLVRVSSRWLLPREAFFWHEVSIYAVHERFGGYVGKIALLSTHKAQPAHEVACPCGMTIEGLRDFFDSYEPRAAVVGYPPGEKFAERQQKLLADVETDYRYLASQAWGTFTAGQGSSPY